MKRCPKCNREFTDDSLRFCLEDGTPLISVSREPPPPTEMLPPSLQPTRASAEKTIPSYSREPAFVPSPPPAGRTHPIVIAGVIAMVLLLVVLVALVAIYVIQHSGSPNSNQVNAESPSPGRATPEVVTS